MSDKKKDKKSKEKEGIELPKVDENEDVETTEKHHKSFIELNKTEEGLMTMHKGPTLSLNPFSKASFWGAGRLVRQGAKKIIKHDDIMSLPKKYHSTTLWNTFDPIWKEELKREKPSLFRALKKMFLGEMLLTLLIQTIYGLTAFVIPIILPYMLRYIIIPTREWWLGVVYIAIILVVSLLGSFCYYLSQFMSAMIGIEIRSVLTQLAYRKVLSLEPTKKTNSGVVVNLIANDTQFFADTLAIFNSGLTSPIQIIVATGLMWWHIGAYSLEGIGVFILLMPLSMWLGRRFGTFRQKIQAMGDKRLKLTNELIQGIRIVKFYAWEDALLKNIDKAREAELKEVQGLGYNRAFLIAIMSNTTTLVTIAIFLSYSLGKENFTADIAFTILSLINLLRLPFFILPFTISLVQQYKVTFDRISNFALLPEMTGTRVQTGDGEPIIEIKKGAFTWDYSKPDATPTLQNVDICVKKGQLHMVVGAVGSGKSTLTNGVFGEVRQTAGTRTLQGSVAYVPQEAWIINATVKENILFGEPFDIKKYEEVLDASALKADLLQLPLGDQTEIGERGITLSGGQKQRVSIARALYSNRDVIVMDDPFSAVDSHVGKHLFEKAVQGYLKGKTILLVTNQLQYLAFADNVYVLEEGKMVASGRLFDIKDSCKPLQDLLKNFGEIEEAKKEEPKEEAPKEEKKPDANFAKMMQRKDTVARAELKQEGLVGIDIYWYYIKAGGVAVFTILLFLYAFATICSIMSSWWLAKWTEYPAYPAVGRWGARKVEFFVWIYVGWLLGQAFFTLIAYLVLVSFSTSASRFLHQTMINKVVRAPSSFFDVTPVGRIINRFAKELGLIDALLPMQISQYVNSIFTLLGVFAAMAFGSPWILLAIAPAVAFYIWFQTYYRHTSIELQRLESISRAPIFSHLAETMNGTSCIRAYGMQETFKNMNCFKVDYNTVELHALRYCAGWFGLRLDWLGQFLVFLTLGAIVLTRNYADTIDVGFAGIAMTYMSGITFILSNLNLTAVELETRMNSVERVKEYESLEQEAPAEIPENTPPAEWPTKGTLEFQEYSLAYRKGERVLDNISAFIDDKDKVGIVGRTGAGKSSLMLALFRMVEPEAGKIIIDGIDITTIGLKDLRTKLSIIPQDPVLFMGSVRYNLDPFGEHNDKEIWDVLHMVRLKKVVAALQGGLDEPVEERGSNFSVGQRQLICMARALLRKSKILLMDEATASVDINTDALIQKMVRKNFADVTVLTIAHRLNTIMDSTRVMVLSKGHIEEYDKPATLLKNTGGMFTSMVDANGPAVAEYLKKIAFGEITIVQALEMEKSMDVRGSVDVDHSKKPTQKSESEDKKPKDEKDKKEKGSKKEKKEKKAKEEKKEKKDKKAKEEKKGKKESKEKKQEEKPKKESKKEKKQEKKEKRKEENSSSSDSD